MAEIEETSYFSLPDPLRDAELLKMNENGPFPPFSTQDQERRIRCHSLGFYDNFTDVNDDDSSFRIRKLACTASPHVVALFCLKGEDQRTCSGIIVESSGKKMILTSSYITFGDYSNATNRKVEVLFHTGKKANGEISFVDEFHGIALIDTDLESQEGAFLSTDLVSLKVDVMSLGRNDIFGLMASCGKTKTRRDKLVSDDLMSSTCTISQCGIGGPILDSSSGWIVGMNVYMEKKSSAFIPSTILLQCLEQLLEYGKVVRPWLGIKTRSITEINLVELDHIFQRFPSTDGILVDEVISGSPAQIALLQTGDVIISCNNIPVTSSVQLSELLLRTGRVKITARAIELKIQRPSVRKTIDKSIKFEACPPSNIINRWPDLPLDLSYNSCDFLLSSQGSIYSTFDNAIPPPVLQQMHMAGSHPPRHLFKGFRNAAPIVPHLSHAPAGFVLDHYPMHAFPFGQRQPNFGGPGMMSSSDAFHRLSEMESREAPMPIHPFPSLAMYGREMDMDFRS